MQVLGAHADGGRGRSAEAQTAASVQSCILANANCGTPLLHTLSVSYTQSHSSAQSGPGPTHLVARTLGHHVEGVCIFCPVHHGQDVNNMLGMEQVLFYEVF